MTETAIQAALSSPYRVQDPELAGRVAAVDRIIRPRQQIIYAKQLAMENSMKSIRHSLVAASILAAFLVPAAPAAFALGAGTTYRGIYTEADGTPDSPAASYSLEIMQRTVASQSVTPDTGTTYRGIYTEARGTPDAPAASYSLQVMQKKIVPSSSPITLELRGVPAY